jgi:hypothetical protein
VDVLDLQQRGSRRRHELLLMTATEPEPTPLEDYEANQGLHTETNTMTGEPDPEAKPT